MASGKATKSINRYKNSAHLKSPILNLILVVLTAVEMPGNSLSENILSLICGLGILQGILLAALIYFHPKSDRSVNIFLAFYIFCISAVMTMPVLFNIIGWKRSYTVQAIPVLPPIFLYFYILSFKKRITWKNALPHFLIVPVIFVLSYLNLSALAEIYPDAKRIPTEGLKRPLTFTVIITRTVQQFIYYFLSRKALQSYQKSIQHLFSDTSRIDLHWARFLVNGFIVLIGAFLIVFPLLIKYPEYFDSLLLLNMAIATPYIYMATFKGVMQPTIWQVQQGIKKEIIEEELQEVELIQNETNEEQAVKTAKFKLAPGIIEEINKNLIHLMEHDKLFLEPALTLQQLADKLQYPTYQVSQAINDGMKKSFYDIINGYRVEEAKRLLTDPKNDNYTILSVGFEAGFNSKTTFNTVFKKFTGLSPTEFRENKKRVAMPA